MGRSGYVEFDGDDILQEGRWRGIVKSAIRGKRGQKFLRDLLAALDAMPEKRLVEEDLIDDAGQVCTLGAACLARGLDPKEFDPEDHDALGRAFDIAPPLVQEIEWENDETCGGITPERRWTRMREWVAAQIKPAAGGEGGCLATIRNPEEEKHDAK